jgi:predicted nucleic acid-binding protein
LRSIFADTSYWIALTNSGDSWHEDALEASDGLNDAQIVTTEPVITEFLNYFCTFGSYWRQQALFRSELILQNRQVTVLPYESHSLRRAMELYAARADKRYSLTDCFSMREMRDRQIYEVLTTDEHFAQEGFIVMLR